MNEDNVQREPQNTVEGAAAAGMAAIEAYLELEGARLLKCYVVLYAEGTDPDCTAAGHGYEDGVDLFAELMGHIVGMAKQMGLELNVVPMLEQPRGQG